jgi:hypothetical protein
MSNHTDTKSVVVNFDPVDPPGRVGALQEATDVLTGEVADLGSMVTESPLNLDRLVDLVEGLTNCLGEVESEAVELHCSAKNARGLTVTSG